MRLSAQILNALKDRNGLDGHAVEDVIWGNVTQVMSRAAVWRALRFGVDLDQAIPGLSINRFCASGLEAVNMANQTRGGAGQAYIAGGVEMMGAWQWAQTVRPSVDPSVAEHLFRASGHLCDIIATEYGFSRDDCDKAVASQQRAKAAG